jgi:hypothetical protein
MRLPHHEQARIDLRKLQGYCLSFEHEEGRHKARVFKSALGLEARDAEWLRDQILAALASNEAARLPASSHGERYQVDVPVVHGGKFASVRTAWIVRAGENAPCLTTCFVL